jgi:hypothetical protein
MGYRCLECGTPVGAGTGIDAYKHAVACYHIADVGLERNLELFSKRTDDYGKRVYQHLLLAKEEGE